jgi:hypothetical protein
MSDDLEQLPRRHIAREHFLQVAIRQFVRDAIANPPHYFFMAMNAPLNATVNQRARAVAAGEIQGRPDTVLFCPNGNTLWAEIKHGKGKTSTAQEDVMSRLRLIGHQTAVVNSVEAYCIYLRMCKVALRPNAELIAADLDLKVAARIIKAEHRASSPGRATRTEPRFTATVRLARRMNRDGLG